MALLLSWNVAGRVRGAGDQMAAVLAARWDVICLQEIRATAAGAWRSALGDAGYSVAVSPWPTEASSTRRLAVLLASRATLDVLPPLPGLPWPERHLAARTALDGVEVEVHGLHSPLSQKPERVKVRTLEAVHAALVAPCEVPRVLCGDLNAPRYESREGEVVTFAQTSSGKLREDYGERHDRAERLLVEDLVREHGWRDGFRSLHGYARRDRSYLVKPPAYGWRLDHVLCSPGVDPVACDYLHPWARELRLSDHSGMWAQLRVG